MWSDNRKKIGYPVLKNLKFQNKKLKEQIINVTHMHINTKDIWNKLGLLNLAQILKNVSQACKMLGNSRDTFYQYRNLIDEGAEIALHDIWRHKPNLMIWIAFVEAHIVALDRKKFDDEACGKIETAHPCFLVFNVTLFPKIHFILDL